MTDLLSHEESIIEQGKQRVDSEEEIEARHYAELLKAYIKLNKEQNRLIRLSDKSQKKLSVANAKLANFSTKLSKYFSPEVYNSLFTGELDVKVQTQRKLLTIFFSDLEGFTELTERLEPEVLTELLTHYLTEMSKIALRWGGTIDKYIGDAIMIFFGDPASKGEKLMPSIVSGWQWRWSTNWRKFVQSGKIKALRSHSMREWGSTLGSVPLGILVPKTG